MVRLKKNNIFVDDFAKKYDLDVKLVVTVLKKNGYSKAAPGAILPEEQIELLKKKFNIVCSSNAAKKSGLVVNSTDIFEGITVDQLASLLHMQVSEVIMQFMQEGIFANKNYALSKKELDRFISLNDIVVQEDMKKEEAISDSFFALKHGFEGTESRHPIIAVLGHVDHGKTSLLDVIRKTKVALGEAGGITQNIGAYSVKTNHGEVVFLDTPGHAAFEAARLRGATVADIVILLVALDSGVQEQTIEIIKAIKKLDVAIVVALNKIDKVSEDRVEEVKRQLSDFGILSDEWGGSIPFIAISAKNKIGIDDLIEIVSLQAESLDLKTNSSKAAQGYVLESHVKKGRGAVATIILYMGTARVGDFFICGAISGKISSIMNSYGDALSAVGASVPVVISGFSDIPKAGDVFSVVSESDSKKKKKEIELQERSSFNKIDTSMIPVLNNKGDAILVSVILRAATQSALDALASMLNTLQKKEEVIIRIVHKDIGDIFENILDLAETTSAIILGFRSKVSSIHESSYSAVNVYISDIIYELENKVKEHIEQERLNARIIEPIAKGYVKAVFNFKTVGIIAGVHIESGKASVGNFVEIYRDNKKIGQGSIKLLQKDRSKVESVQSGDDCAFSLSSFKTWKQNDTVLFYEKVKKVVA